MSMFQGITQPQAVFLAGTVGALGAIFASVITNFFGNFLTSRMQGNAKYLELRRDAYAKTYSSVEAFWDCYDENGEPYNDSEVIEKRREDMRDAFAHAFFLVKRNETKIALENLHWAAGRLAFSGDRDWVDVHQDLFERFQDFVQETRRDLNLPSLKRDSYDKYIALLYGHDSAEQ